MMINEEKLKEEFVRQNGMIVGGSTLWKALGFGTYAAFYRSWNKGTLGVRVFAIPGRKGQFALSEDVVEWVVRMAKHQSDQDISPDPEGKGEIP
jgi:hypothetical protein